MAGIKKAAAFAALAATVLAATFATACNGTDGSAAAHRDAENAVNKKGVCVSRYNDGKANSAQKVNDLNAGWYYTWGIKSNNEYINAEFVPMIWGGAHVTQENISYVKENYESGKFTRLLTFNEPDLSAESNMTVDEALSYWEDLQSIGIPLSSPAVSSYAGDGAKWLDEFMKKASERGYRVDFIAIHSYQSFYSAGAANQLKTQVLDVLYNKYKLPIWLTEFGAVDIVSRDTNANRPVDKDNPPLSPNCTAKNAQSYMEQATNMLEQCGYVERYAWFMDNFAGLYGDDRPWEAPYTTLYNDDDSISQVGETYKNLQSVKPLVLETTLLEAGNVGNKYEQTLKVCGGTGDYTFTASGLPAGLIISPSGKISGTPQKSAIYPVKITITDSGNGNRRQTRTHNFTLNIKN